MRRHLLPSLRVLALLLVAGAVLLYVDYRVARAAVFERILGLTGRMAPYLDDTTSVELPRLVKINGARFWVAAGHTDHPPEMVRKFYRDRYSGKDGALADLAKDLEKKGKLPPGRPEMNAFDFGDAERGGVGALEFNEGGKSDMRQWVARMAQVVSKGDLGDVAKLRYAYTEKRGEGGTRFLTIWTDEKFNLNQLVPAGGVGDVPGFDVEGVPRYPGAVRVFSMEEEGVRHRMSVYESMGSPDTGAMFFRGRMGAQGWAEDPNFAKILGQQGKVGLQLTRDGHEVFLSLSDRVDGKGLTTVVMQTH